MRPSRRRTALDVPISGKPEIGAPPQDEVCGFKLHPPDPTGFMELIYQSIAFRRPRRTVAHGSQISEAGNVLSKVTRFLVCNHASD
jgi:hypothetical protein